MKKILKISVIAICNLLTLFAQDVINPPKFSFFTSTIGRYDTLIYRNVRPYVLGYNWGSQGARLDSALRMDTYHDFPFSTTNVRYNELIIQPPNKWDSNPNNCINITAGHDMNVVLNAHCLHLEPTLTIDSTEHFQPRTGDTTGAVFGWLNKNIGTNGSSSTIDFDRFILNRTSVTSPSLVLSNVWKNNALHWLDYDRRYNAIKITNDSIENSTNDKIIYHPFNGKQLYCSVNIRALNQDSIERHLDDTILVIRIPYILTHYKNTNLDTISSTDNDFVKFDMIPDTSRSQNKPINSSLPDTNFRGIYRELVNISANRTTSFAITGRMLKNLDTRTPSSSITLSALARFTGDTLLNGTFLDNPRLKNIWYKNLYGYKNYITELDLEVTYYGNLNIAIDWIRLETPRCQKVLRGFYDSLIWAGVFYNFDRIRANSTNPKLFRFYADDEMLPSQWLANRYFNYLVDTLAALETFVTKNPATHYLYATGFKEYWNGDVLELKSWIFNPYIQKGKESPDSSLFCLRGGYEGNNLYNFTNIKDSPYETLLMGHFTTLPITDTLIYEYKWPHQYYNYSRSVQYHTDETRYHNFYKNSDLLFHDNPWWANLWINVNFRTIYHYFDEYEEYDYLSEFVDRPKTGEETRLILNSAICLGAKGLIYWIKRETWQNFEYDTFHNNKFYELGLLPHNYLGTTAQINYDNSLSDRDYLYSDHLGSDFIVAEPYTDPNSLNLLVNSESILHMYNFPLMGIDQSHVYTGLKSTRTEMSKIHNWIKENENTLMNLKLQAWFGKGFLKLYKQYPKITTSDILDKYIDCNNILTCPIGRNTYEQGTVIDSGFYDITLFKDHSQNDNNQNMLISVLNRRTDPLIEISQNDSTTFLLTNKKVGWNFIPSAEFDQLVNFGETLTGNDELKRNFFITKWWNRLGCREFRIELKPIKNAENKYPHHIVISEIGHEMNDWYMKEPFNNLISEQKEHFEIIENYPTRVVGNAYFTFKLLPGQNKIFQLTYVYDKLSNKEEKKKSVSIHDKNSIVHYHKTYLKEDTTVNDKHSVWYRRSLPIDKTNPNAEVQWEPEQLVSKYYDFVDSDSNVVCTQGYNTLWCGPPQLVVRYDSTRSEDMVYIFWNGVCKYASDSTKGYLFESVFPAEDTTQVIPETVNKVYDYYTDLYPDGNEFEIGTVSLNASKGGNYYAWSDARDGLCYAWKAPQDTAFVNTGTIPILNYPGTSFNCFLHPDLNRYSRIDEGEDEAAIVFEGKTERTTDSASLQVFYTRLRKTRSGLQNYVSIMPLPGTPATPVTTDVSNKVIWQSANMPQTAIHKLPKIHRNIAKYEMPNAIDSTLETLQLKMDRIYWTAEDQLTYKNIILTNGYDLIDSLVNNVWNPKYYIGQMPSVILNANGDVAEPTFAQGVMKDQIVNNDTLKTYYNDSSMVLSFTADGNRIFNLPHNFWTFMNPIGIDITTTPNLNEFVNTGTEPTLPAIPMVKDDSLYKFMRTFYLDNSSNTMESRENFFKTQNFSKKYHTFFGISNNEKKARWFTPLALTDEQGRIQSPKVYTHKLDGNRLIPRDTIITDWFDVGTIKSVDFIEKGNLTSDYSMKIQRKSDGKLYSMSNSEQADNRYRIRTKMLLNGKNEKYRIIWAINEENARFVEQIVIGDIAQRAELDGMLEERELGKLGDVQAEEFLDLNEETYSNSETKYGLSVYPNPANDEIYVVCYLPRTELLKNNELKSELNLKLYNNLGKEVYSKEIKAGQIIRIPTDNFLSGSYFVKVFQHDQTTIPAEVKSVIIQK